VQLKVGEPFIGVTNADSRWNDAFAEAVERLLSTLVRQLAIAIMRL
jgi:GAF domain-containing protein